MKVIYLGEAELPCDACGGNHETGHQRFCDDCWVDIPEWVESAFSKSNMQFDTVNYQLHHQFEKIHTKSFNGVLLNGSYSLETLKAIVWWMEQGEIRHQRGLSE